VDHLFRHRAGQMVSYLTRVFGPSHVSLAEEVVQDALVKALQQWPFHGIPDNPGAWLLRVARNGALDVLRRETWLRDRVPQIRAELEIPELVEPEDPVLDHELRDDQLGMIFLCCHPRIPRDARVALSLKTVAGFSGAEIARAFLIDETTIAQRIVRAKRELRAENVAFEMPVGDELSSRLDSVLDVLYLLFNEGYAAHQGEDLIRLDLCSEAIRLTRLLTDSAVTARPKVHALLALMLLQAARFPARTDATGDLVLLSEQDRGLWDQCLIAEGFAHFERAANGDELTAYHIQAAIAALHAQADRDETTDWPAILDLYEQLSGLAPSPVILLNHAVALCKVKGPRVALDALDRITDHRAMRRYHLLPAARAEFWKELGNLDRARASYRDALECQCSEPERRFLTRCLEALEE
jgi:RNA polymerase sigma-70 factor (ECF subfamily)